MTPALWFVFALVAAGSAALIAVGIAADRRTQRQGPTPTHPSTRGRPPRAAP